MRRLLLVVTAVSLLGPGTARAKCAAPGPFFAPEAGSALPTDATLFVFVPGAPDPPRTFSVVDGEGRPVRHAASVAGTTPAFVTHRIEVRARAGELVIELKDPRAPDRPLRARYRIEPTTPRAPAHAVEIRKVEGESSAWTCSHQATQNLAPSVVAPAYRVEWAASEADWLAGKRQAIVVPYRMERFFHWKKEPYEAPPEGQVELGHVNCHGHTFDWKGAPIWVGLAALHADGGVDLPAQRPVRVEPPQAPSRRGED